MSKPIPRSLAKDKADSNAINRTARERCLLPYYPYFFNQDHMPVWLNHCYFSQSAFLFAGGISVRDIEVHWLSDVWTMTLNNAHATFRGNASCVVDDPSRFSLSMWLDPTILKFVPASHFDKPLWDNRRIVTRGNARQHWERTDIKLRECPGVFGFRRNEKFHAPRWLEEETINWGNHGRYGGGRSVMLAALRILYILGFRRVYLLGVDFDMSEKKRYHFAEERTPAAVRGNVSTYAKLQRWFSELQPLFVKAGFLVYNCNPKSKLTAFPHMPFQDALAAATAPLGDFRNERTVGMYQKYEDKLKSQDVVRAEVTSKLS